MGTKSVRPTLEAVIITAHVRLGPRVPALSAECAARVASPSLFVAVQGKIVTSGGSPDGTRPSAKRW